MWSRLALLSFLFLLIAGCGARAKPPATAKPVATAATAPRGATVAPPAAPRAAIAAAPEAPPAELDSTAGRRLIAHAQALANAGKMHDGQRRDCSGFVMDVFRAAGRPLTIPDRYQRFRNVSAMLHDWSTSEGRLFRGTPHPGDLVFFRDTIGDVAGHVTHVALVERVRDDGTIELIHYISGRIRRDSMNLARPGDHTVNAWLRKKKHAAEPALAGELFVGYARF